MSSERPEESSEVSRPRQTSDAQQGGETAAHEPSEAAACRQATVLVRGETVRDQQPNAPSRTSKHVFSKVTRSVFAQEQDQHKAEVFEPSPSSVPSQLLRSARELTRSRPMTWTDAAVNFFGYEPLAKALYRKLNDQFEEHIS